jgi:CHAD domain-containing protein
MRAGAAVRAVLSVQLQAMLANEAGMLADRDPEDLHRYRVALRRTRSCIGQMKRTLPKRRMAQFKPGFAWLGSVTGPTRDLDVFLKDMKRYRKRLDKKKHPGLKPLTELIREDKQRAHRRLVDKLDSDRYRKLISAWQRFLEAPFDVEDGRLSSQPIDEVATERIRSRYERMISSGRRLDAMEETDRLHRLRIDGKKLRYLLEFFRDLFAAESVDPLIAALKHLQDHLGEFNDLVVQQDALAKMIPRLESIPGTPQVTFVAIQGLLEDLARRELRVRRRFADQFAQFDSDDTAQRIGISS